ECAHGYPRFVIHDGSSSNLPLTALVADNPPTPKLVGLTESCIKFPDCDPAATARFTSCNAKLWSCNIGRSGLLSLRRLLRRHALTDSWQIHQARHWCPVRYVLFDLLFHAGRRLMRMPLIRRRELLAEVCGRLDRVVVFSPGMADGANPGNGWGRRSVWIGGW